MRQYNHETTGATFLIIDYGKKMQNGHSVNVCYSDGVTFCNSQGWADSYGEACELMRARAEMFGVKFVGFERVA